MMASRGAEHSSQSSVIVLVVISPIISSRISSSVTKRDREHLSKDSAESEDCTAALEELLPIREDTSRTLPPNSRTGAGLRLLHVYISMPVVGREAPGEPEASR